MTSLVFTLICASSCKAGRNPSWWRRYHNLLATLLWFRAKGATVQCWALLPNLVRFFATLWTGAHQPPLSMEILQARILACVATPSSGDLPNPGVEPRSPALQADSLPSELPGKPKGAADLRLSFGLTLPVFPQGLTWSIQRYVVDSSSIHGL